MPAVTQDSVPTAQASTTMYQITTSKPEGELNDEELLKLVNYFEVSRADLKNV